MGDKKKKGKEIKEQKTDNLENLTAEIESLKEEKERLNDAYLRLAAEYDNYKKRQTKNFSEMVSAARDALLLKILDVLDNFERAIQSYEEPPSVDLLVEGIDLIHKQFVDMLHSEDIHTVCEIGDCFDPQIHEAVAMVPSDEKENTVVGVLQKGFKCGERLIRPAKVLVSNHLEDEKD
ncbi:nucleotide exchange factor GrpE [bacterium]|nr:nucleotide exchange factor GrpE [bacterium]